MVLNLISSSKPYWLNMLGIGLPKVYDISFCYVDAVESIEDTIIMLKEHHSEIYAPDFSTKPANAKNKSHIYKRIDDFVTLNDCLEEPSDSHCKGTVAIFSSENKKHIYLLLKKIQEMVPLVTILHEEFHVVQLYGLESYIAEKMKKESSVEIDFSQILNIETQAYIPGVHMLIKKNIPLELINGKHGSLFEAARDIYFNAYFKAHPEKEHDLFMGIMHL
jgi:hypothetical protein